VGHTKEFRKVKEMCLNAYRRMPIGKVIAKLPYINIRETMCGSFWSKIGWKQGRMHCWNQNKYYKADTEI
jgi:hypothetical protein